MDCPVVKVTDTPPGLTEFRIRDSRGVRLGYFQLVTTALDDELMDDLHDWAVRHARDLPDLHIMPASVSSG